MLCAVCIVGMCAVFMCGVCVCVCMALWVEVLVVKSKDVSWDPQDAHDGIRESTPSMFSEPHMEYQPFPNK